MLATVKTVVNYRYFKNSFYLLYNQKRSSLLMFSPSLTISMIIVTNLKQKQFYASKSRTGSPDLYYFVVLDFSYLKLLRILESKISQFLRYRSISLYEIYNVWDLKLKLAVTSFSSSFLLERVLFSRQSIPAE